MNSASSMDGIARRAAAHCWALALLTHSFPASAAEVPKASSTDSRVRYVDYDENQVFRLAGVFRSATHIIFGEGEEIASVALGDTASWEVAPAENMLFVKPREAAGPTNLIVVTRRGAMVHTYAFELSVRSGSIAPGTDVIFQLRFRYPAEVHQAKAAAAQRRDAIDAARIESQAIKLALDADTAQGPRNLDYLVAGSSDLEPSEISDNGRTTALRFPRNQEIPAIFSVGSDGNESLLPYDVRGEFVIIHQLVRELRLRSGRSLLCIWNNAFDRYGADLSGGTSSADVKRVTGETK